jgi:putative membrane protein
MFAPPGADTFTTTPRRAWFIRPLSWRRNGFRLTDDVLLLRRGLVWRKLSILPLARLQSFAVHQGPLDRLLRIASGRGHVVTGPVWTSLAAIDRDESLRLFSDVARGTVRASSVDRTHRWAAEPVGSPPEDGAMAERPALGVTGLPAGVPAIVGRSDAEAPGAEDETSRRTDATSERPL